MERPATEGDSPVSERFCSREGYPSTTGHVKSGGNLGRPFSKAKYYLSTDSERVPRGKGEKYPGEGSEIVPETVRLQAVEALCRKECVTAYLLHHEPVSYGVWRG